MKLANCPFCGSDDVRSSQGTHPDDDSDVSMIICSNCGACGPAAASNFQGAAEIAWNTRTEIEPKFTAKAPPIERELDSSVAMGTG